MTIEKPSPDLTGISERLNALHQKLLVGIALGNSLSNVMTAFCRDIEALAPDVVCSVIGVDDDGRMRPIAGPSLPESYAEAISGIQVGPDVGSCGTAIYLRTAIEVCDIATDPLWAPYKFLALPYGLHACWSCPIVSQDGHVLGAFGLYFREKRPSNAFERRIVAECLNFCAIAITNSEAQTRLNNLAFFDPLTGLGNRATLENKLPLILKRASEEQHSVTVYHVDIADFQAINDLHGRVAGDMMLARVGQLLRSIAADSDLIVRTGGDQFIVVKSARAEHFDPEEFAHDIVHGLGGGHRIDGGEEVMLEVRVGLASFPGDGSEQAELLENAETALQRAKRSGRIHVKFEPQLEHERRQRRSLERDIKLAIERRELSVVFQPQVDAKSGAIQAFEALVRWTHSELGPISPMQFIPIAESNGAIHAIGEFVLRQACEEAAQWNEKLRVAVNVSAAQIVRNDFVELVADVLSHTQLDPARLELEVTESLFVQDLATASMTLRRLKRLGVSVAMDDFGTGYSSLSTLRAFPFDRIKVDRSFVCDMVNSPDAAAIVNSVVGLGRTMGLRVVAEGVESQEQVKMLRSIGCHEIQGYLFGKPLAAKSYEHVTRPSRCPAASKKRARHAPRANSGR